MADPDPRARTLRVHFDDAFFDEDIAIASSTAADIARNAREKYSTTGVPLSELRRCDEESRDGTRLGGCLKTYLPPPSGRFGMVLRFAIIDEQLRLAYLAFGVRHHPRGSRAQTVYELAHRRLRRDAPG